MQNVDVLDVHVPSIILTATEVVVPLGIGKFI
jgi:hypothetical protein